MRFWLLLSGMTLEFHAFYKSLFSSPLHVTWQVWHCNWYQLSVNSLHCINIWGDEEYFFLGTSILFHQYSIHNCFNFTVLFFSLLCSTWVYWIKLIKYKKGIAFDVHVLSCQEKMLSFLDNYSVSGNVNLKVIRLWLIWIRIHVLIFMSTYVSLYNRKDSKRPMILNLLQTRQQFPCQLNGNQKMNRNIGLHSSWNCGYTNTLLHLTGTWPT